MASAEFEHDEIIVTSCRNSVTLYNSSGTKTLKNYKVNDVAPKSLALLGEDYFISGSTNIPEIKVWNIRDERKMEKNPCGKVSALATTSCGTFCAAAFKTEIRIWNVHNGEMLSSFSKHYQDITCLRFTSDGSFLISGGKDGFVKTWVLSKMISVTTNPEKENAFYSWNHHSKAVTDIFVGSMGIYSRVATSSMDSTCKIYELTTGILLATLCLEKSLTAVIMDPLEYYLILGTANGLIHKVNLYNELPREAHSNTMDKEEISAHNDEISCLSISLSGEKFLSASVDGILKIWETATLDNIFAFKSNGGAFDNAYFILCPSSLLNNYAPTILLKPMQRSFIPRHQRNPISSSMPLKIQNRNLSKNKAGSIHSFYSNEAMEGDDPKTPPSELTVAEIKEKEELFQQVLLGESINEVRDINSQMYTYILDHAFESMGNVERLEPGMIGDD